MKILIALSLILALGGEVKPIKHATCDCDTDTDCMMKCGGDGGPAPKRIRV